MPEYRDGSSPAYMAGGQLGTLSKYLNLKKAFDYASQQHQWEVESEQRKINQEQWKVKQEQLQQPISPAGSMGEGGVPEGMEITGYYSDGKPMIRKIGMTPQQRELSKAEGQVQSQKMKQASQSETDFAVAKNKLSTTYMAFKEMGEAAGGTGRIKGFIGSKIGGMTGTNPYANAYKGQLVEAAAALAKLAAPSARVGKDIIALFEKTLPNELSTTPEALNQIRYSLHNAFATVLGRQGLSYTPELRQQIEDMFREITGESGQNNSVGKYTYQ